MPRSISPPKPRRITSPPTDKPPRRVWNTSGLKRGGSPGRTAGVPNKFTATLKDMILGALDHAGGIRYLTAQAQKNPTAFLMLVGKVLPLQVTDGEGKPLIPTTLTFVFVRQSDAENQT